MKLILENWNKFITLERKTNIVYERISDYFFDVLENHKKYYKFENSVIDYKKNPEPNLDPLLYFRFKPKDGAFDESEHKRFLDFTNQDLILQDPKKFEKAMRMFNIQIWDRAKRPAAGADMNNDGTMRIFVPKDNVNLDLLAKYDTDSTASYVMQTFVLPKAETLKHELGHWINSIRAGYRAFRTSGSGEDTIKQFLPRADGGVHYANSTEEMQARISDVFNVLRTEFSKFGSYKGESTQIDAFPLAKAIVENKPKLFINKILDFFGQTFYYDQLTKSNKRRLYNRLYEIFLFFKENIKDYKDLNDYADYASEEVPVLQERWNSFIKEIK